MEREGLINIFDKICGKLKCRSRITEVIAHLAFITQPVPHQKLKPTKLQLLHILFILFLERLVLTSLLIENSTKLTSEIRNKIIRILKVD